MNLDQDRAALEDAAQTGAPEAMFELAKALAGDDSERSERLYRDAAERGEMRAAHNLARLLEARGDLEEAKKWYRRGVELGADRSMVNLGILIEEDHPDEAGELFRNAAEAGNVSGMYHLGLLLERSDPELSNGWLERAVAQGHVKSQCALGRRLLEQDRGRALALLRGAAESGNVIAMSVLGSALSDDPDSREEAQRWLTLAEQEGSETARYNLAFFLRDIDRERAKQLFTRLAEGGDVNAMLSLIAIADQEDDEYAARKWAVAAAELGDPQAQARVRWYQENSKGRTGGRIRRWGRR